jgi:hypothetical protein
MRTGSKLCFSSVSSVSSKFICWQHLQSLLQACRDPLRFQANSAASTLKYSKRAEPHPSKQVLLQGSEYAERILPRCKQARKLCSEQSETWILPKHERQIIRMHSSCECGFVLLPFAPWILLLFYHHLLE